jgi:hypothetical protein
MVKIDIEILKEIKNLILEEKWYIDKSAGMEEDYYEMLNDKYKNILLYLVCEEIDRKEFFNNYHS